MNIQRSYREAAIQGASPVELVVRLYEQIIEDLRQAKIAIEQKNIQLRSNRIKHAILVIGHLQSTLNFAEGGQVAKKLEEFYDTLRQNLVQVQFSPSKRGLAQQITDLQLLREAWIKVDQAERLSATAATSACASSGFALSARHPDSESDRVRMDWQG
jgi:flagellar secretion chaperone FliS